MATSMQAHTAASFAFNQAERGHDNRGIARRSPPHHVTETPGNAYSNVMPIESLMDFSSRNERRYPTSDTQDHRLDLKDSQKSDDSFSAYVKDQVSDSPPQHRESLHNLLSRQEAFRSLPQEVGIPEQESHDKKNSSWPSTVIDADECFDQEGNRSQESTFYQASQPLDEDDDDDLGGDADPNGEKKRRRRTNKAEANVLASVFAQTQFPDAHTRDVLAKRLNMKSKAVSIWFQNRRQAMKKRASRFGGVEGVNGPTVTAATMQVLDVNEVGRDHGELNGFGADRLMRWMSFGDISATDVAQRQRETIVTASQPVQSTSTAMNDAVEKEEEELDLSSAPILEMICRRRSQQQLSRMTSLPSLASVILAKDDNKVVMRKDLRDLLPSKIEVKGPIHARVHSQDHAQEGTMGAISKERTERTDLDEQAAVGECILKQGMVTFPAILADENKRSEANAGKRSMDIWQRMQSSSSSSDGIYSSPDSNKENQDPTATRKYQENADAHEDEDEERTLRLIAGRRAAKEQAKKEKKLSEQGRRYLEEADARVALQQRRGTSMGGNQQMSSSALGKGLPSTLVRRNERHWNRAVTEAQTRHTSRANTLARIPSLDITAGRDRAKEDVANQNLRVIIEQRMASRLAHIHDENTHTSIREKKTSKAMQRIQQRHTSNRSPFSSMPLQATRNASSNTSRSFVATQSLPASNILSRYTAPLTHSSLSHTPARYDVSRESNARLNGQEVTSLPSSQEGSENGSDEWLEAWARERRRETQIASTPNHDKILCERSAGLLNSAASKFKSPVSSKRSARSVLQPTPRHNDSGFYGSDSEPDDDYSGLRRSSKRRLVSQDNTSSSPTKRGDERDRLAAETLLGLGSRA